MPSPARLAAIQTILQRPAVAVERPAQLDELWASNVFSLDTMKSALPKAVFKAIQRSMREGGRLDGSVADVVAQAM
ncbi:MAG: glutamine synthetase III, partial [Cyanobium sp.]